MLSGGCLGVFAIEHEVDELLDVSLDRDFRELLAETPSMPLAEALGEVHAMLRGTLISCIAGQLAYYEGEDPHERYVLHRRVQP